MKPAAAARLEAVASSSRPAAARLPRRWSPGARLRAVRRQITAARQAARQHWRRAVVVAAWSGGADGFGSERQRALFNFVDQADPALMVSFEEHAHPEVIIAMRQTITNMLGTLPPHYFRVVISTEAANLAQLMYSVLMTGYMFANAWTRLSLTRSMAEQPVAGLLEPELAMSGGGGSGSALASLDDCGLSPADYAPGSQKLSVEGEVLRWHYEHGKEVVPALQYIEQLEAELTELRQQMEAASAAAAQAEARGRLQPGNELLDYLKLLTAEDLVSLTDCASEDVLEAMNVFVQRLMGMEEEAWQGGTSDCTASELAQLLYWLMITGYELRLMEQRLNLSRTLDLPPPPGTEPPSLPPGRLR